MSWLVSSCKVLFWSTALRRCLIQGLFLVLSSRHRVGMRGKGGFIVVLLILVWLANGLGVNELGGQFTCR